jgi:hypothetical protein
MERAVDKQLIERKEPSPVTIPRPLEGGSYSVESMGRFVDRLLGHDRAVREAAEHIEPLLARQEDMPADPQPNQIPEPIPGGSEPITRGEEPPTER